MQNTKELLFPSFGLEQTKSQYDDQRDGTTNVGVNVRTYDAIEGRGRGGSRAGLTRWINQKVNGTSLIQHLNSIVTTAATALASHDVNDFYPVDYPGGTFLENFPDAYPGDDVYTLNGVLGGYGYLPDPAFPNSLRIPTYGSGIQPTPVSARLTTPLITWANFTITAGTPLSSTQLNATFTDADTSATLTGTATYSPYTTGDSPGVGTYSMKVLFVPDNGNYRYGRKIVTMTVNPT